MKLNYKLNLKTNNKSYRILLSQIYKKKNKMTKNNANWILKTSKTNTNKMNKNQNKKKEKAKNSLKKKIKIKLNWKESHKMIILSIVRILIFILL